MLVKQESIEVADKLRDEGHLEQAEQMYRRLIAETPTSALAHYKLGVVLARSGDMEEAESTYREALRLMPNYPEAAHNLALILNTVKALTVPEARREAEWLFHTALAENPDYFEAHLNLGNLVYTVGRFPEAFYHFRRALNIRPDSAAAYHCLGNVHRRVDQPVESIAALEQAVALDPSISDAWNSLGACHLGLSHVDEAITHFRRAEQAAPGSLFALKNIALSLNYICVSKEEVYDAHLELGEAMRRAVAATRDEKFAYPRADTAKRLRIGFVSSDFRGHSVSFFMLNLLRELDHRNFEYHAFYTTDQEDERSQIFRTLLHYWHRVHALTIPELADKVRQQQIDILIDLTGHTTHSRTELFALRAAPVQMSWIGYPNTSGLNEIQYRITDNWADPPGGGDAFHTEKLLRMPRSFLCYSPPDTAPEVVPPPSERNGYITFGSFNLRTKISAQCIELWALVLKAVPTSRLLLKSVFGFGDETLKAAFLESFARHGVASERITLLTSESSLGSHLGRYGDIDIAVDTFPYCGTTTTCEALWMGVPVITLAGDRHVSRVGVSLLNNAGLPELVAADAGAYVQLAVDLAADPERLQTLRSSMRDRLRSSALLDAKGMARDIEGVWRDVWAQYCASASDGALPDAEPEMAAVRLCLGGSAERDGWTLVDLEGDHSAEIRARLGDLSLFEDDSCTEVYCAHQLQRVPTAEVLKVLQELHRILQPGGRLYLSVPDLDVLAELLLHPELSKGRKFQAMRHAFGMQADEFDFNRTGLNFDFLTDCLADTGFSDFEHVESFNLFDDASESRIEGMLVSLNLVVTK